MDVVEDTKLSLLQSVKRSQYQSIKWKSTKEPILTIQLLENNLWNSICLNIIACITMANFE